MHLVIITPIFPPATGGAATYYAMLAQALVERQVVRRVTVLTEKFPGEPDRAEVHAGRLVVVRRFPFRAGGTTGRWQALWRYALQNLDYARLPGLFRRWGADAVLVHTGFHNRFNLLAPVVRRLSRQVLMIGDVRDHLLPAQRLPVLEHYRHLIACSENVAAHLQRHGPLRERITRIPIPQETLVIGAPQAEAALAAHGLQPHGYLLFAGLLKTGKGVDRLLDAYRAFRRLRPDPPDLVLAGMVKDAALADLAGREAGVRKLGPVPRNQLLALMQQAALNVNLSPAEGMPRASLEALALGARVILPPGIPEFEQHCARWVAGRDSDAQTLALQFCDALDNPPPTHYPIAQHGMDQLLPRYQALLGPAPAPASP